MTGPSKKLFVTQENKVVLGKCVKSYIDTGGRGLSDDDKDVCAKILLEEKSISDALVLIALRLLLAKMVGEEQAAAVVQQARAEASSGPPKGRREPEF